MAEFEIGVSAAILIDGRDETRLNNKASVQDGREILDVTTFQAPGRAKEYAYGLGSGAAGFEGFSHLDPQVLRAQLATAFGRDKNRKKVLIGPRSLLHGSEALFFDSLLADIGADVTVSGVPTVNADFATSKSMVRDGVCLHALNGNAGVGGNEKWRLTLSAADQWQFLAFKSGATTRPQFTLQQFANQAALLAFVKSDLEALHPGRTVTITTVTALSGTNTRNGVFDLEWDGSTDIAATEIIGGAVQSAAIANGNTGNYAFNGGANFTLPITEVAFQANQRTATGVNTLVAKGASSAEAPVFGAMAALPQSSGNFAWSASVNGKAYVFASGSAGTAIREYDPATNAWTTKSAVLPANSLYCAAAAVGSTIYLFGGGNTADTVHSTAIREYDPVTDTISTKSAVLPQGRAYMSAALSGNGKIYLFGGVGSSVNIYEYDPVANTSATKVNLSFSRIRPALLVSGSKIYVVSGNNPATEIYDTVANTVTNAGLASAYGDSYPASVQIGNTVYIVNEFQGAQSEKLTITTPSLAMKSYLPVGATPSAPTASGQGATISSAAPQNAAIATTLEGGQTAAIYNVVTASGADAWIDGGQSRVGFCVASHLAAVAPGGSVQIIIDHADGDATAPNLSTSAELVAHTHTERGAKETGSPTTVVKRWTRCRYVLTGAQAVFTAALERGIFLPAP